MTKYICKGRIHPERSNLSFGQFGLKADVSSQIEARIRCENSRVAVDLEVAHGNSLEEVRLRAEEMANIAVQSAGFSIGAECSAEILEIEKEDGEPETIGFIPIGSGSGQTLGLEPYEDIFHKAVQLSSKNVHFRRALRDYLRAITYHEDRAFYCYRAIEAVKAAFPGEKDSDA